MYLGFGFQFSLVSKTYNLIYFEFASQVPSHLLVALLRAASVVGPGTCSTLSKFVLKLFCAWQGVDTSQPQSWEARSTLLWEILTGLLENHQKLKTTSIHTGLPGKFPHSVKRAQTFSGWTAADTLSAEDNLSTGLPAWKHKSLKTQVLLSQFGKL